MKNPLILTSHLTSPPRYYVTRAWKMRDVRGKNNPTKSYVNVEVTGRKFDVTEQIEAIIAERTESVQRQMDSPSPATKESLWCGPRTI